MQVHSPITQNFNCRTCQVSIVTQQEFKLHFKSDFHRYNIKRQNVSLRPATLEQFQNKKHEIIRQQTQSWKCNECGKKFGSKNTFDQHVLSKKHDPNKKIPQTETLGARNKTQPFEKSELKCLFCLWKSQDVQKNLKHMQVDHGFFIGSKQWCINIKDLLIYLQQKIQVGNICIYCDNRKAKDFATGQAVRKHMVDKCHCFMKTSQGYEEYEKYYDFSSQFLAKLEQQKGFIPAGIQFEQVKVLKSDKIIKNQSKQANGNQDEDWQDQQEDEKGDNDDNDWEEIEQQQAQSDQKMVEKDLRESAEKENQKLKVKKYMIMRPTLMSNDELLLPNGKILGNRKYKFLYRQTYRVNFWENMRMKQLEQAESRALVTQKQMFQLMRRDKLLRRSQLANKKCFLKIGMTNNTQMHYRCQNAL